MGYACHQISEEVAVKMYSDMATLQVMDTIFYEAQRQGRISFYLTTIGEEAINIASAAALHFDDLIFPQVNKHALFLHVFVQLTFSIQFDFVHTFTCSFVYPKLQLIHPFLLLVRVN